MCNCFHALISIDDVLSMLHINICRLQNSEKYIYFFFFGRLISLTNKARPEISKEEKTENRKTLHQRKRKITPFSPIYWTLFMPMFKPKKRHRLDIRKIYNYENLWNTSSSNPRSMIPNKRDKKCRDPESLYNRIQFYRWAQIAVSKLWSRNTFLNATSILLTK